MSAPLSSLPGDIPGLLRLGSPVVVDFWSAHLHDVDLTGDPEIDGTPEDHHCMGVVEAVIAGVFHVAWMATEAEEGGSDGIHPSWLSLYLTDPTARAHAAWFIQQHRAGTEIEGYDPAIDMLLFVAMSGDDMNPEAINALAHLVLRLAGREGWTP